MKFQVEKVNLEIYFNLLERDILILLNFSQAFSDKEYLNFGFPNCGGNLSSMINP